VNVAGGRRVPRLAREGYEAAAGPSARGSAELESDDEILHASAVRVHGRGLLVIGASGTGKSGLALRLMTLGADLVADDRVSLRREGDSLVARPPAALAGRIEARGVGILRVDHVASAPIALVVDLDAAPEARMPQPRKFARAGLRIELISGRDVPNLAHAVNIMLKTVRSRS